MAHDRRLAANPVALWQRQWQQWQRLLHLWHLAR